MKKMMITAMMMAMCLTMSAQTDATSGATPGDGNARKEQRMRPQAMSIEQRTDMLVRELKLSDEQAAKVKELNAKYSTLFQRPEGGNMPRRNEEMTDEQRKEMRTKMEARRAQMEQYQGEMKQILTEDQQKAYAKMMSRRGPGRRGGNGNGNGAPRRRDMN